MAELVRTRGTCDPLGEGPSMTDVQDRLDPVHRPNGKLYRPHKLIAAPVCDEDDALIGVVVFGTHTLTKRVMELADRFTAWQLGDVRRAGSSTSGPPLQEHGPRRPSPPDQAPR